MVLSTEQIRILSNYFRMLFTVVLGLWLVRILVDISPDVYAVIVLMGTSVGVAGMLTEMVRGTMVPELSLALNSGIPRKFETTLSSSFILSILAAIFAVFILSLFYYFLTSFSIPQHLLAAAKIFLLTRMVSVFIAIAVAPATNLLPITNRMISYNFWRVLERAAEVLSAFSIWYFFSDELPAVMLEYFAYTSLVATTLVIMSWALHGYYCQSTARIKLSAVSLSEVKNITKTAGWNGFVVLSMNLYFRFDVFLMNILFGVTGTFIFGIATQLVNYTRQLTIGLVQGLDAVAAKLHSNKKSGAPENPVNLLLITSHMQALLTLGGAVFILMNTKDLFFVWLGDRINASEGTYSSIVLICQIMLVGISARSLSEGWMKFLSGSGNVKKYGPTLLIGAVFNPVLIAGLYFLLPVEYKILSIPISFSVLLLIVHLVALPKIVTKHFEITHNELFQPFKIPLLLAVLAALFDVFVDMFILESEFARLAVSAVVFSIVFGPFLWISWRRIGKDKSGKLINKI